MIGPAVIGDIEAEAAQRLERGCIVIVEDRSQDILTRIGVEDDQVDVGRRLRIVPGEAGLRGLLR